MFCKSCSIPILVIALAASGCGPAKPVRVPISGTVTLDGQPLAEGTIFFKTIREGSVDELAIQQGRFEGQVEVGERRVEVSHFISSGAPGGFPTFTDTIPARYNTQSELTAAVTKGGENAFTFALKSK